MPGVNAGPADLCGSPSTQTWSSFEDNGASCFPDGISITFRFERTNDLKIQSGQGIRRSALLVLAILSSGLSPFAHGQAPATSITNLPTAETVVLPKSVPDPIEPFNRVMWGFNKGLMTGVIKPTSRVYRFVVVKPVRTGIGNFGRNLTYPGRLINNLLQGKWNGARDES